MKKTDLIHKLKQLQGISDDERAYLINLVNTKKKYGLVWEEKPEDVEEQLRENLPVLKEVKDRAIINGEEYPNHILIEGDNLHALTALTFTHEGKIDVIYIDPPYNTGNKDFKYNDTFVDKEDSYRHSKWLSFMSKRLEIAKRLLSDKGVIFISIDDNEQAQLKLLCDEIFSQENYLADIIWKSRQIVDSRNESNISIDHENIIAFKKCSKARLKGRRISEDKYSNPDNDSRGPWMSNSILGLADAKARPNLHYALIDPITNIEYPCPPKTGWRYSFETIQKKIAEKRIIFPKKIGGRPREKKFQFENKSEYTGFSTILSEDVGYTLHGTRLLRDILPDSDLISFPKPVELIREIVNQSFEQSPVILDFFAGSGTTLHATMQLNAEDGGNRQCILVTNNENNICEEVTYERNKRVMQGYTNAKGERVEGLSGNNLRYFKNEFVSREPSVKNKKEITRLATELLCIKEDCYTLSEHDFKELQNGQDLSAVEIRSAFKKHMKLFESNGSRLLVIYDDAAIEAAVEIIKYLNNYGNHTHPNNPVQTKVYVFSNGQYPYTEEFEEVLPYITLCALPDAIYKAYQNVLPKRVRTRLPDLQDEQETLPVLDEIDSRDKKQGNLFNT